jgi:hypothetical protein
MTRPLPKTSNDFEPLSSSPITSMRTASTGRPVVSFADFLTETGGGDDILSNDDKQSNQESSSTPIQKIQLNLNSDS